MQYLLFKKGERELARNCRPVSLRRISKLQEKGIRIQEEAFLVRCYLQEKKH